MTYPTADRWADRRRESAELSTLVEVLGNKKAQENSSPMRLSVLIRREQGRFGVETR
jgi:hypothetical protein